MAETTVGLFGTGRIGLAVARRLRPFGFQIIAYDPYADVDAVADAGITLVDLGELFARSHVLSLHAPATPETTGIVNPRTSRRCPLVDSSSIPLGGPSSTRTRSSRHSTAVSWQGWRSTFSSPNPCPLGHGLRSHPNAILTPHTAFYSEQSLRDLQRLAADEAGRAGRGERLRCPVN